MQIKYHDNLSCQEHIPCAFWAVSLLMMGMLVTAIAFISSPIFLHLEGGGLYAWDGNF